MQSDIWLFINSRTPLKEKNHYTIIVVDGGRKKLTATDLRDIELAKCGVSSDFTLNYANTVVGALGAFEF